MSFTPNLSDRSIANISSNSNFRNANREAYWGIPVFYCPSSYPYNTDGGYGGPKYKPGYNYTNSTDPYLGNCTWWCCGRLQEAEGISLPGGLGNASQWYSNYSGSKTTDCTNINPGDIIVLTDGDFGHVMFVEQVTSSTVYVSQSAASTRSVWSGYACRVTSFPRSSIYAGNTIDMYSGIDSSPYYQEIIGLLRTGNPSPIPPTPTTDTPAITVYPSSYQSIMLDSEDYLDFQFYIVITGIPSGYNAQNGNTYPGLSRVQNSGWSYTDYTYNGSTYRRGTKTQTLRYYREYDYAYTITKYMYFNITYPNGTINSTTPMYIQVQAKQNPPTPGTEGVLFLEWDGGNAFII